MVATAALAGSSQGAQNAKKPRKADVRVSVTTFPKAIVQGDTAGYAVLIQNLSSVTARNVTFVGVDLNASYCLAEPFDCPAGATLGSLKFLSFEPSQGTCAERNAGFSCALGTMRGRAIAQITVQAVPRLISYQQPTAWGASAMSSTAERNYQNNFAEADVYVAVKREP